MSNCLLISLVIFFNIFNQFLFNFILKSLPLVNENSGFATVDIGIIVWGEHMYFSLFISQNNVPSFSLTGQNPN
jgi:hypothetical protein